MQTTTGIATAADRMVVELANGPRWRVVVALMSFALLAFWPGQSSLPPIDRDEPRYAQAARQMIETGNYVDIRYQDTPRYRQPAGIYWLQAAAAKISGYGARAPIWVHRLPSRIGAAAAVALTWWAVLPIAGPAGAFVAALLLAGSVLLGFEARIAKTDAVLLATTVAAVGVLARAYLEQTLDRATALLFWVALGAGLLVKGPLILLPVASIVLGLLVVDRKARWLANLRPAIGIPVLLLIVAPWLIAIAFISDGAFFEMALGDNLFGKVAAGQEGHSAPPGTYLALFWLTFAPAAVLAIPAASWVWANRREPAVRFCLAWIVPTWLVFELVVTKLPHYVLPTYPAIAALIALALMRGVKPRAWIGVAMIALAVGCTAVANTTLFVVEGIVAPAAIGAGLVAILVAVWWSRHHHHWSPATAAAVLAVASVVNIGAAFALVAPRLETIWLSQRLAAAVSRIATCPSPAVVSVGHHEPSLVFLVGTGTLLGWPADAASAMAAGGCRIALVTEDAEAPFADELAKRGSAAALVERVEGVNIGKVGRRTIGVYRPQR